MHEHRVTLRCARPGYDRSLGWILTPAQKMNLDIEQLACPALLFQEGYVHVVHKPSEFAKWDSRVVDDPTQIEWQIADAEGRLARILHLERIDPPSRLHGVLALLTSSVFVRPAIEVIEQMTLPDFRRHIEPMLLEYRMYGNAFGDDEQAFLRDLRKVKSFPELFNFLADTV
jgi:hypothetical protein